MLSFLPLLLPPSPRFAQLSRLQLYSVAAAWSELLNEEPRRPMLPEAWLDGLIDAELADREVHDLL